MKTKVSERGEPLSLTDNRVQLLLGRFFNGELETIQPVLDPEYGVRYPSLENIIDNPGEAQHLLDQLEGINLLQKEPCGHIASCKSCGSTRISQVTYGPPQSTWKCLSCGSSVSDSPPLRPVHRYLLSPEGVERVTDHLISKPILDFLRERGYATQSPSTIMGESHVEHTFDIVAFNEEERESILAIDFAISDKRLGEEKVISMFAKVYDTNPQRALLVAFPGLSVKARRLAKQYELEVMETQNLKSLWKELLKIIPPVDEFRRETLDVMTLLSLPDHLRKTASVVCEKGRSTAEEISEITERARAVESGYLNQLVRMGYLRKQREGRRVLFSVMGV
ncbi:MAG: hypothetical protein PVH79_02840 [Candidatus Bathyarchaeota archaeon]